MTCALLEDPEAACPWLGGAGSSSPAASDPHRPTVISAADVHDALFAFVRRRIREGKVLAEIQQEVDASTRVLPSEGACEGQRQPRPHQEQPPAAAAVVVAAETAAKE